MDILGVSAFFHDSAAALVRDGVVLAAAQEERFSRLKHDARLPVEAAQWCLEQGATRIADVDHVVFYEKPLRKFERLLNGTLQEFPYGLAQFTRMLPLWLGRRLWMKGDIAQGLGCSPSQLLFCEHHLSHAASAYLCSPFQNAAIITADGVGEDATTAIHHGVTDEKGTRITTLRELVYPHSVGLLYSAITAYLGFEVNEGEYKVMGLAAYGHPNLEKEFAQICQLDDDGAVTLDLRYFSFHRHHSRSFTPLLEALLGPARVPGSPLLPRFANVAATLQAFTNRAMVALAREASRLTGEQNLCMAGGVALNGVANHAVATDGAFADVFIQPAAGDAGGALGAALWAAHVVHGAPRVAQVGNSLLGARWSTAEVTSWLTDLKVKHTVMEDRDQLFESVAARLAQGQVGGWMDGRFEWGPRALGSRSILADARHPHMKERLNDKIKFREPFRPFAPAALEEDVPRFFDVHPAERGLTRAMLTVTPVTELGRSTLPSVTHADGTARLQTVTSEDHAGLHGLLTAFKRQTGVGVLLNTSMNLKDEPLCSSPAQALSVLRRSGLDFLVMEGCLVEREVSA